MPPESPRLARNYLLLAAGECAAKLLAFLAYTYLGRTLGPERYGRLEFALAALVFFTLPVDFGLQDYGARQVARDPGRAGRLLDEIVGLRLLLALVSLGALMLFALASPGEAKWLLATLGASLLAAPWLVQWMLQGHDRMPAVALVSVARLGVFAALALLLVGPKTPLPVVGLAECGAAVAAAAAGLFLIRQGLGLPLPRPVFDWARLRDHFREASPIGLSELCWAVLWYGATVLLGWMAPGEQLGWFGAAHRILMALHTFVWLYFFNLLPSLSRSAARPPLLQTLLRRSLAVAMPAGLGVALGLSAVARPLLALAYGERFAGAAPLFSILVWMLPVSLWSGHYRYTLIAGGRQRWLLAAAAVAALVALPLGALLIGRFGALGAAWSLLAALSVNGVLAWAFVRRLLLRAPAPIAARLS